MYIKEMEIVNFRNYNNVKINLYDKINIIYGNNAGGKTNLLESIYVLGLTKSHRSFIDNNLIKNGCDFFRLSGSLKKDNMIYNLEVSNNRHKKLKIDNKEIGKISDYISKMNIIIFYPEDLEIIKGSPSIRRNFLDLELSQLYSNYINVLSEYNRLLKMRNERLKNDQKNNYQYLQILTDYLIDRAIMIYKMREKMVAKINEYCPKIYKDLTSNEGFKIKYKPNIDLSLIKESKKYLLDLYQKNYYKEIRLGKTIAGPHLDDVEFYLGDINLKNYGSQGQQRIAVIAIKLAEIEIFKKHKNDSPILLLDDVFSELDITKRNNLIKYIDGNIQTIITTTDLENFDENILKNAKIIKVDNGKIIEK